MAKTISIDLSLKGIQDLKQYLLDYADSLKNKLDRFVYELANEGIPVIESNMAEASYTYDEKGIQSGSDTAHQTYVKLNSFGDYAKATLIVEGAEVLFIEFGAGVALNKDEENGIGVGASPHPLGPQYGFLLGSYGQGHGAQNVWGYYADSGELVLTRGTKATMPVYKASLEIRNSVVEIAKRVFGGS